MTRAPLDAELVIARLEEAGRTLLCLPNDAAIAAMLRRHGFERPPDRLALPLPSASAISRMDEALGWLSLIPQERRALRRILGLRALVHPLTDRHLHAWRRIGRALGADHKAVQRWHAEAVDLVVVALAR